MPKTKTANQLKKSTKTNKKMSEKTVKKQVKKTDKKIVVSAAASDLKTDLYSDKGDKVGKIALPKEVFGVKINQSLLAQAVRVYLENQRQGTRKAKTRGETRGSTRKIYRQKGTGRARHGDIKAPIFVGGGVAHGPRVKDFHLDFSQKMKKLALYNALTQSFQSNKIKIINNLDKLTPKTKEMFNFLKNMSIIDKTKKVQKSTLLVVDKTDNNLYLAGRNLPFFEISQVSQLNPYQILNSNTLLFLKNALDYFNPKKDKNTK